jgi:hypothetical protein
MKKIIKRLSIALAIICGTGILIAGAGSVAMAADATSTGNKDEICKGIEATGGTCEDDGTLNNVIKNIVNVFSWVVGAVAVIMIIYGGFRYVTAGGDSGNVSTAKNTILYALVGLVIVALAQVIVKFVLNKATSTPTP